MKKISLAIIALLFCIAAFSQSFDVPAHINHEKKEDYAKYEPDIINAAKWLVATPLNEQTLKRQRISAFVMNWINGSPSVNVELNENIMDFEKKNPGMLMLFMAGCARYVLENNYSKDMRAKHKAAFKGMMDVYQSSSAITKDKKMEKMIKAWDDGKMDEWLEKNLKVGE